MNDCALASPIINKHSANETSEVVALNVSVIAYPMLFILVRGKLDSKYSTDLCIRRRIHLLWPIFSRK